MYCLSVCDIVTVLCVIMALVAVKTMRLLCAPSGARFLRVKVPNPPGSGKDIAEGKGVEGDLESEGSRM